MWSGTDVEIELTLIRHGQTKGNLEHRYIGRTEEALCEEGREALEKNRARFLQAHLQPEILFVSPMVRCRESAGILFPGLEMVEIPQWREMDFGCFEGKNYQELQGDSDYQKWIDSNGTLPFPDGESREAFIERVEKGFYKMVEYVKENAPACLRAAAVVHGGTIMALLSTFCGGDYFDYQVKNAEGYQCHISKQDDKYRWKVTKL